MVLSWERYVRICLVSNLVSGAGDYFSGRKFKMYLAIIVIFPVVFYLPKFFEVSTD